jgi:two-component system nitrogen regulation sensor histidine kinase NtrY
VKSSELVSDNRAPIVGLAAVFQWSRKVRLAGKLAFALAIAAFAAGVATFFVLTPAAGAAVDAEVLRWLLLLDLVLLLLLTVAVAAEFVRIWIERRRGIAGSRLHVRIVTLFSLVAATPAIIMAVFAALFFQFGLREWFGSRVNTAINESVAVAEAYIAEHRKVIQVEVLAMAKDLNRDARELTRSPELFNQLVASHTRFRGLSEAVVFDGSGRILARSDFSLAITFERVPPSALEAASRGEVAILTSEADDRVRALVKLENFLDAYLFVGRFVDPRVIDHLERTYAAVAQFRHLQAQQSSIQIAFAALFSGLVALVLLAAVWYGLHMANRLARPIGAMADAAERVGRGDLSVQVAASESDDEIALLGRTFNHMTNELATQRGELIEANRQLDERWRFTETVLAGVTAGVIGIGRDGRITVANPSATKHLLVSPERLIGQSFVAVVPEMSELYLTASASDKPAQAQINLRRVGSARNLLVQVSPESAMGEHLGYVVTFDDITDLVQAQRTAAWADIARRIAHEIKNPLTPIQLSAERLKRKYVNEIANDPEVFANCTDTIIRQVHDLGRMVDEFSAFARLPAPRFKDESLSEILRQAIFLQQVGHSEIEYVTDLTADGVAIRCDRRQIAQVLTNVLLNAAEAIESRPGPRAELPRGRIQVSLKRLPDGGLGVDIIDNGRGLPKENRERLTEPYVTTRAKGTGLGLAIVKKIMEEHGGQLLLADAPEGGALIQLRFPPPAWDLQADAKTALASSQA